MSNHVWGYRKEVTPQTYIRDLPPKMLYDIAAELDHVTTGTTWRDLAMSIPKSRVDPTPKFSMSDLRAFGAASSQRSPTISVLYAWGVTNSVAEDLANLLHKLKLPKLAEEILPAAPPPYMPMATPAGHNHDMPVHRTPPFYPPKMTREPQESLDESALSLPMKEPISLTTSSSPYLFNSIPLEDLDLNRDLQLPSFPYSSLQELTQNFNESFKLGEGAFGSVFHGEVTESLSQSIKSSGSSKGNFHRIAIKRLKLEVPSLVIAVREQFKKEIEIISELDHENILPLVGYSCDGPELCLVYDYMFNGSLSAILESCRKGKSILNIPQRVDIAIGSATGIEYLHSKKLIHRDIKSSNILLDVYKKARISDFGLIRSLSQNQNKSCTVTSQAIGTPVYMAPEAYTGEISTAMDVYGFGVVLLELLTSLAPFDEDRDPRGLVSYLEDHYDELEDEGLEQMADKTAGKWDVAVIKQFHTVATECLERRRKRRPQINKVINELKLIATQL